MGRPGPLEIENIIRQEGAVGFNYLMVTRCITNNSSLLLERRICGRSNGTNEGATRSAGHMWQQEHGTQQLLCINKYRIPSGYGPSK